jgi:hypothetical protein
MPETPVPPLPPLRGRGGGTVLKAREHVSLLPPLALGWEREQGEGVVFPPLALRHLLSD